MERCVDASVAIKWVIATESEREKALALLQDSIHAGITLIAPTLFPVEVDSIIRKRVHPYGTAEEGVQAYVQLDVVPVQIIDPPDLRQRSREMQRGSISASFTIPCMRRLPICVNANCGRPILDSIVL